MGHLPTDAQVQSCRQHKFRIPMSLEKVDPSCLHQQQQYQQTAFMFWLSATNTEHPSLQTSQSFHSMGHLSLMIF